MITRTNRLFLASALILTIGTTAYHYLTSFTYVAGKPYALDPRKPHILITRITDNYGGAEVHTLQLYKRLIHKGYPATLVIDNCKQLVQQLEQEGLAYYKIAPLRTIGLWCRPLGNFLLAKALKPICQQSEAQIVQTNNFPEAIAAKHIAKMLNLKVVLTIHGSGLQPLTTKTKKRLEHIDALVGVNPRIIDHYQELNQALDLTIKNFAFIPPLFNSDTLEKFVAPNISKPDYFKRVFDIQVGNAPVVTMVANFYAAKNQPLLIQAMHILINQKHREIHCMLAGDGYTRSDRKRLQHARELVVQYKLENYIHFLGFVKDTASLMHHSDIVTLSSTDEGLGLVLVEAGFLQRPTVGASGTGTAVIIDHEKTGLVFKNGDAQDLATQLERLLQNPAWAQQLGRNGKTRVMEHFHPERSCEQYEEVYERFYPPRYVKTPPKN